MSGVAEAFTIPLEPPVEPDGLSALTAAADAALAGGARRIIVDLNSLEVLEAPVIATLIGVLRLAHEHGADVHLAVSRPGILSTLKVTALDKLFTVGPAPTPPAGPPPKPPVKRLRTRAAATASGLVLALLFGAGTRADALAPSIPSANEVMAHLTALNPELHTYRAHLRVDLQLRTFPYIAQHLEGMTYFKRPDNYEVVLTKVPSYAKGFDKLYTDIGDPSSWERRFNMTVVGERTYSGHSDLVVRLVQKVRGMIDHEDVLVDPRAWRVDNMEWYYYNGGVISMSLEYGAVGGFDVVRAQHATIRIPFVHASAEGRYDDYHVNVPVDDAVFTKGKR